MQFYPIGHTIITLPSVDSTNNYAATLLNETNVMNGTVIMAKSQTNGRGQMGTHWMVNPQENLTFSVVLKDMKIPISRQFLISIWVSISVSEFLRDRFAIDNQIKWPNDILVNTKKICGILIENTIRGNAIAHSIVGIGLNINQKKFKSEISATSVAIETDTEVDIEEAFKELLSYLSKNFSLLLMQDEKQLFQKYYSNLLGYQYEKTFKRINEEIFLGKIIGVKPNGLIVIENEKGVEEMFNLKEISFIL